jgi:chromosome segregation ATPase
MSNVIQSVRGVVQGTLQRRKPQLVASARVKDSDCNVNRAIEELEKIFGDAVGRLKARVIEDQAVVASETQHAEHFIEGLKGNMSALEAKLKETEDTVQRKELASREMEERLDADVRDLQSSVKNKEEVLETRESEINDLKSKIDGLLGQIAQLDLGSQQVKAEAASKAKAAEQIMQGLKANITMLEARLRETEDTIQIKELAGREMEERLGTEIRELQSSLKKTQEALDTRQSEIHHFKAKTELLVGQVTKFELASRQTKAEAVSKGQAAEQTIEGLKASITVLEAKLREVEGTVDSKELASQKMEESLGTEIRELQSVVKKKEEALETRESEVNDLELKTDALLKQVTQLELAIHHGKGEAASDAPYAEPVVAGFQVNTAMFQAQLSPTEQMVRGTDPAINGFHQNSFEQNSRASDLNSKFEPQASGMMDIKEEALLDRPAEAIDTAVADEELKTGEANSTTLGFPAAVITPTVTEAALETVSRETFEHVIAEFGDLTNVMRNIASLIVRDHARALGESMEEFPKARLTKLVESLSKGISDEKLKADFCVRFGNL